MLAKSKNGGGNLASKSKKKGFAISGILYPLLILTLFLVVQILFMMQTRKNVLDKSKKELADSVNASNTIYNNEELSTLIQEQAKTINEQKDIIKNLDKRLSDELKNTKLIVDRLNSDTGWNTLTTGVNYRKIDKVVFVEFINYQPTVTWWHIVGQLPDEYRTTRTRHGSSVGYNGSTGNDVMTSIDSYGQLSVYNNKAESLVGMFVYPIG